MIFVVLNVTTYNNLPIEHITGTVHIDIT